MVYIVSLVAQCTVHSPHNTLAAAVDLVKMIFTSFVAIIFLFLFSANFGHLSNVINGYVGERRIVRLLYCSS